VARTGTNLGEIRDRVVAVLLADSTIAAAVGTRVFPTRIQAIPPAQIPCIVVYVVGERGQINGWSCGAPNFASEFDIQVELHVTGSSDPLVGVAMDLMDEVANAILSDQTLGDMVDGWVRYTRDADVGITETQARRACAVCTVTGQGQVSYVVGA
jgi:hypothetical protein